jgi:hypothetical protein
MTDGPASAKNSFFLAKTLRTALLGTFGLSLALISYNTAGYTLHIE